MTAENIKLNGYITYSVFLLNGEAVGLYGRFDVNKICGVEALWLPICMTDTKGTITSIKMNLILNRGIYYVNYCIITCYDYFISKY